MTAPSPLALALAYAARGSLVLPLDRDGKTPLLPETAATTSEVRIRHWWKHKPTALAGIVVNGKVVPVTSLPAPLAVPPARRSPIPPLPEPAPGAFAAPSLAPAPKQSASTGGTPSAQASVDDLRRQLLANGYQPVAVETGRKRPIAEVWTNTTGLPRFDASAANTGVLTRGLRVVDVDLDDSDKVAIVAELVRRHFGLAPIRTRPGSVRFCIICRAAEGEPRKRTIKLEGLNRKGKPNQIEILGKGQQFVADGEHPDGGAYTWEHASLLDTPRSELPAITEAQLDAFEAELLLTLGVIAAANGAGRPSGPLPETTLADIEAALDALPNDYNRDWWIKLGMAAYVGSGGAAITAFDAWSRKHSSYHEHNTCVAWRSFEGTREVTEATLFDEVFRRVPGWRKPSAGATVRGEPRANEGGHPEAPQEPDDQGADEKADKKRELPGGVELADFVAYMPAHNYIFQATGDAWPASSVNARLGLVSESAAEGGKCKAVPASGWLDRHAPVEQMTWAPGQPQIINDKLISEGGWIERCGARVFNLYRPPTIAPRTGDVLRWLEHARRVFGGEAEHIIKWLAHRVQRPHEKINHALVLGGLQGIGKDTLLEPVNKAVGPWNFTEVAPHHLLGRFNGFVKSVILRVSEVRDLGDVDRFKLYDHLKALTAAPPDVLRVDEKNIREYSILNVCGVILTTNHKADGLFLPADDRRHYVAWSDLTKDDFPPDYWRGIYA